MTGPPPADPFTWHAVPDDEPVRDEVLPQPVSLCWMGEHLLVADEYRRSIAILSRDGALEGTVGREGDGPGEFRQLHAVECPPTADFFLAIDAGRRKLDYFDAEGEFLWSVPAPETPQGVPYLGSFAVFDDSTLADSWLGATVGPYFEVSTWDTLMTIRLWSSRGEPLSTFGQPILYSEPATTREFNRLALDTSPNRLWVLNLASAVLRSYASGGGAPQDEVWLPIYGRGPDPIVETGAPLPNGYRRNRVLYHAGTGGFASLTDSLFVVIRYVNYRTVERESAGGPYRDYWPESRLDIISAEANVIRSLEVPGRVRDVAVGAGGMLAVISEELETGARRVLLGHEPRLSRR